MSFTYTDKNLKTILHSWGRFRGTLYEDVVVGDLIAAKVDVDSGFQLADATGSLACIAIACENGLDGDTIWLSLSVEMKAPTTIATGGVATQTYFADSGDTFGSVIYLGDNGKLSSSSGTLAQECGFILSRDRVLVTPNAFLTSTSLSLSSTLTVTGATALNGGLTMDTNKFIVADTSGNTTIAGTLTLADVVSIDDTTESTSVVTGSLHTDGGLGVAKDIFVGENVSIATGYALTSAAELNLNSVDEITIKFGGVDALQIDENAISSFAAEAVTAGHAVYVETEDGGAATGVGAAGGLYNFKTGDGSVAAGAGNSAGGVGGALSLITGAGAAGGVTNGAGGAGGAVAVTSGAGAGGDGAGTGGAGGAIGITAGVGAESPDNVSNTSGAGGTVTLTAGAGGLSSGSSGVGGAGGAIHLTPGAGGGADTGTAGLIGYARVTSGYNFQIGNCAAWTTSQGTNSLQMLVGTSADGTATDTLSLTVTGSGDDWTAEHADGTTEEILT